MAEAVEGAGNDEGAFKTGFGDAEFFICRVRWVFAKLVPTGMWGWERFGKR